MTANTDYTCIYICMHSLAAGVAAADVHPEIRNTRTRNKMIQNFAMVLDFNTRAKNKKLVGIIKV